MVSLLDCWDCQIVGIAGMASWLNCYKANIMEGVQQIVLSKAKAERHKGLINNVLHLYFLVSLR
jgi:hypothetical protein